MSKSKQSEIPWCGLKDDPELIQCCCNCKYHVPVYFHCCTKPKPTIKDRAKVNATTGCDCGVQKGWACDLPEIIGVFDNWPEHSCGCELYNPVIPHPIKHSKTDE